MGEYVEVSINGNQTEVVLRTDDGIKHNKKYLLSVTAINMIGNKTSHMGMVVGKWYRHLDFRNYC